MTDLETSERPELTPEELALLVEVGEIRDLGKGDTLFDRGEAGRSMFVVERGEVDLIFEQNSSKRVPAGGFFGELVLLVKGHNRTASAVAASDCRLREIDLAALDRLQEKEPALLVSLLRRTSGYLLRSEEMLIKDLRRQNLQLENTLDYLRRTREELDVADLLANTDELTGLYNRRCFNNQVEKFFSRSRQTGEGLVLLLIDLDQFKQINDRHGHAIGDLVLEHFAGGLRDALRRSDLPCRIGGDEFSVLLPGVDEKRGEIRAQELMRSLGRIVVAEANDSLTVTASMGGAAITQGDTWGSMFERADSNLYLAKRKGRSRLGWGGRISTVIE